MMNYVDTDTDDADADVKEEVEEVEEEADPDLDTPIDLLTLPESYELFGVSKSCSMDTLRRRYRHLVVRSHPDRGGDPLLFRLVQSAFATISRSRRELRKDVVPDEQWSRILDEVIERRRDPVLVHEYHPMTSEEFHRTFEQHHHAPLSFADDPMEMREARRALMRGDRIVDTQPAHMCEFILHKWQDPDELITANLAAARLQVPTLIHTSIPCLRTLTSSSKSSSTSSTSVGTTDLLEAFANPPCDIVQTWREPGDVEDRLRAYKAERESNAASAEDDAQGAWVKQVMRNLSDDHDLSIVGTLSEELAALTTASVSFLH